MKLGFIGKKKKKNEEDNPMYPLVMFSVALTRCAYDSPVKALNNLSVLFSMQHFRELLNKVSQDRENSDFLKYTTDNQTNLIKAQEGGNKIYRTLAEHINTSADKIASKGYDTETIQKIMKTPGGTGNHYEWNVNPLIVNTEETPKVSPQEEERAVVLQSNPNKIKYYFICSFNDLNCYIIHHTDYNIIYVVFRGTLSVKSAIKDLRFKKKEIKTRTQQEINTTTDLNNPMFNKANNGYVISSFPSLEIGSTPKAIEFWEKIKQKYNLEVGSQITHFKQNGQQGNFNYTAKTPEVSFREIINETNLNKSATLLFKNQKDTFSQEVKLSSLISNNAPEGNVHMGFLENFDQVFSRICYCIVALQAKQKEQCKIFTTGHSLGGALTTVFSYLYTRYYTTIENLCSRVKTKEGIACVAPHKKIHCVAVSAPKVGGENYSISFMKEIGNIEYLNLFNRKDIVPKLPKFPLGSKWYRVGGKERIMLCDNSAKGRFTGNTNYKKNLNCVEGLAPKLSDMNTGSNDPHLFMYYINFMVNTRSINQVRPEKKYLRIIRWDPPDKSPEWTIKNNADKILSGFSTIFIDDWRCNHVLDVESYNNEFKNAEKYNPGILFKVNKNKNKNVEFIQSIIDNGYVTDKDGNRTNTQNSVRFREYKRTCKQREIDGPNTKKVGGMKTKKVGGRKKTRRKRKKSRRKKSRRKKSSRKRTTKRNSRRRKH